MELKRFENTVVGQQLNPAALSVDAASLEATVAAYNAACIQDRPFKPLETDGLATRDDYGPRKSNWARPIDRAPYLAFPIMCGNCFTFGGLKVDPSARVLDTDGDPCRTRAGP